MSKRHVAILISLLLISLLVVSCVTGKSGNTDVLRKLASPTQAADFTLQDNNGKSISLADYDGKVVLLTFWATWCHACKQEMHFLKKMQETYKDKDFTVIGINVDGADEKASAIAVIRSKKLNYPVLFDPESRVNIQFNPSQQLPFGVILDKNHNIRFVLEGYLPGEDEKLENTIRLLLAE